MYAILPSLDAATSCGSAPAATRPTILRLTGSATASIESSFSKINSAVDGVCAEEVFASSGASRQTINTARRTRERNFDLRKNAAPAALPDSEDIGRILRRPSYAVGHRRESGS